MQRDCGSSVLTRIALACLLIAAAAAQAHAAALFPPASQQLSGAEFEYTVESGDTLMEIAARYGVTASVLAVRNGLKLNSILAEGNRLAIDNRHVVPVGRGESIIINVPQRMLFHFGNNSLAGAYPIAVGLPTWRTPLGEFTVAERRRHPVWRVPPSIQREMREQGRRVRTVVPPGRNNPLGDYWIGLSIPNLGIHSTNVPLSIYGYRTHGCIRLNPADAKELFNSSEIGDPGEIIYEPLMFAHLSDGRVFLEVNLDIYELGQSGETYAKALANAEHISDLIDWARAGGVIGAIEGVAREVTKGHGPGTGSK